MEKKYFKVGQTVYNKKYGQGIVYDYKSEHSYPVKVKFDYLNDNISFTYDGKQYLSDPISLSQKPIPEIINEPIDDRIELPDDVVEYFRNVISKDIITYNILKQKYKI